MVAPAFPPKVGGVANYACNLSRELVKHGQKLTVITRGSWTGLRKHTCDGVQVYELPYLHIYPINFAVHQIFQTKLFRSLEHDFDLVHAHHPLCPPVETSLPLVLTMHSSLGPSGTRSIEFQNFYSGSINLPPHLFSLIRMYFRSIEKRTIASADIVTTVSQAVRTEVREYYSVEVPSSHVLGNGVDTDLFVPRSTGAEKTSILYTGRLSWNKGLFDLIFSAKYILQKHPDVSFVLTGRGPIETHLKQLVTKMGMHKSFSFVGFVDMQSLVKYYQNATLFVLPSYYEGLPTNLLEAMACGVPVITTAAGGIPEVVVNGENGLIVPVKNPYAIGMAVLTLLEDEDMRLRLSRAARETVESRYSLRTLASRYLQIYKNLAS